MYSEKATNFCKASIVDLSYVVRVKSAMGISQNLVAFSEYINFYSKAGKKFLKQKQILMPYFGLIDARMSASDKV